nr:BTB/POZ fold [Tanacetum cinerariifolium]
MGLVDGMTEVLNKRRKDESSSIVRLNIGGEKFCTTVDTLTQREPHSMLAAMFSGRHTVCKDSEFCTTVDTLTQWEPHSMLAAMFSGRHTVCKDSEAPEMVIKSLESLRANFFWGSHESSKKLSWVKWSNTLDSFDKGGLGVGSISAFNKALLLKWRWRLFNFLNSLWVQLEMILLSAFGRILDLEMILFISDIIDYSTLKTIKIASLVNVFLMVHGNGIGTLIRFLAWFVMGMLNRMTTSFSLVTRLLQFENLFDHGLICLFQAFSRVKIGPTGLIHGMFLRIKRANLSHVDFDYACLKNVSFSHAYLWRASFQMADLTNANLEGANLERAYGSVSGSHCGVTSTKQVKE